VAPKLEVRKSKKNASDSSENSGTAKASPPTPAAADLNCGICFETFILQGVLDCCAHSFCHTCIGEWAKVENTCPMCKKRFKAVQKKDLEHPGKKFKASTVKQRNQRPAEIEPMSYIEWDLDDYDSSEDSDYDHNAHAQDLMNGFMWTMYGSPFGDSDDSAAEYFSSDEDDFDLDDDSMDDMQLNGDAPTPGSYLSPAWNLASLQALNAYLRAGERLPDPIDLTQDSGEEEKAEKSQDSDEAEPEEPPKRKGNKKKGASDSNNNNSARPAAPAAPSTRSRQKAKKTARSA